MWKNLQLSPQQLPPTTIPLVFNNPLKKNGTDTASDSDPSKNQPSILLVEDNSDMVTYLEHILGTHYQIEVATNGQEGINKALEQLPDIIISDVNMPQKTGFELVETLKMSDQTNHIPIILLTGKTQYADKLKGLTYGADAYLVKPFNKKELFIRLKNLLALRKQLERKYATSVLTNDNNSRRAEPVPKGDFIKTIDALLEQHYKDTNFGVQELAKLLTISYSQLYRKLKTLKQSSPVIYIRSFRLEKAKKLLAETAGITISEVAYKVGFDDPNYFSRVFSEHFGQSPNSMKGL